jgi:hypothetical protein
LQAADAVVDDLGGFVPVDDTLLLRDLRSERGARVILRDFDGAVGFEVVDHGQQQLRSQGRQHAFHVAARRVRRDGHAGHRERRTRVEFGCDPHDRHTGLRIAGKHRALDGRSPAVERQDRRVNVDHAESRDGEERVREDPAKRDDDAEIRVEIADLLQESFVANLCRLQNGNAVRERHLFGWRGLQLLAAAPRAIRLGDDGHDFVPRRDQRLERRDRKGRGPEENNPYHLPDFRSF